MVRPSIFTRNIVLFSVLSIMCVLFGACLNPTGVGTIVDRATVNLYYHHGHLRSGDERIYGLHPEKYYLVEILERGVSRGTWFVNSDGKLVEDLHEIGTVSGGEITGLSNDPAFLHIVHYAAPLSGYVTHFDGPIPTAQAVTQRARNGELRLIAPPNIDDRYFLDLSPAHIPAGNRALDYTLAAYYTILGIPVPEAPRQTFEPLIGHPFVIPLHTEAHTAPYTIDYIFARKRRNADGDFYFIRDGFYVIRVIPTFGVTITVYPVDDSTGRFPSIAPVGPLDREQIGQPAPWPGVPYLNLSFDNTILPVFTDIEWRDEFGNLIGTNPTVQLNFLADPEVRMRYNAAGTHIFSLTATRNDTRWSAQVHLIIQ